MTSIEVNKTYCEDCRVTLKRIPDGFFDNCITSPPYYGLRDYGCEDQIGLEETPEQYVAKLVEVFRDVRRCMKPDGTLWLNLGDTYNAYKANTGDTNYAGFSGRPNHKKGLTVSGLKNKDLIGIPWMVAFALRADGWYLRQDIIWSKPNPMPESVTDRCNKAHEYIFLLSKSAKYNYNADAIKELAVNVDSTSPRGSKGNTKLNSGLRKQDMLNKATYTGFNDRYIPVEKVNKRSVWNISTKPFKKAHFAVYPEELIEPCVLTTKKDAIIYDPFGGAGTTGVVALRAGRMFIMSELNPEYVKIAEKRLHPYLNNLFT